MNNEIVQRLNKQTGLTPTGWNLSGITKDQWHDAGEMLVKVDQARQWWLGDWWNACKWGGGKEACDAIGVNYQTAQDCGMVSRAFQFSRRHEKLTFSHHREVCVIDDVMTQDMLLDMTEKEKLTVRQLREEVNKQIELTRMARDILARVEESRVSIAQRLADVREILSDTQYEEWFQATIASNEFYDLACDMGLFNEKEEPLCRTK